MSKTPAPKKPNLLIFIADQWRADVVGHLGNPAARTPHLDRLVATEAVSFAQAFCQNPVCTPSRCSFMTGLYPQTQGHRSMSFPLQSGEANLLQQLRREGYYVWWGGKNDLVTDEESFAAACDYRHPPKVHHTHLHQDQTWRSTEGGIDYSFYAGKLEKDPGEECYLDSDWSHVLGAVEFLKNYDSAQPFCLFLPLVYPHPPYGVEEPYFSAINRSQLPPRIRAQDLQPGKPKMHAELRKELHLEGRPEAWWDGLRATYYGMCSRIDAQAGLLIQTTKDLGLFDETAMFFFSDHGDYTGDYDLVEKAQNLFEDCIVHVPFIFKPPAAQGRASGLRHGLVELVDFPATVYELTGITPDYTHFGRSLVPLLKHDAEHRDAVFTCGGRLESERHCSVESKDFDETFLYYPRLQIQARDSVAHGKAVMCREKRFKLVHRLYEEDELYDLESDPGETINRINDPLLSSEKERLYVRLRRFFMETSDTVPLPAFPRDVPSAPKEFNLKEARVRSAKIAAPAALKTP